MKRVYIKTYGCQMNERDSEAVAALLRARGYALARSEQDADVILLNTCSVRDVAEQKAIGKMGVLAELKRRKPGLVLGYLGCMAQSRGASLVQSQPAVDLVVGTQKFHNVPDYLDRLFGRAGWPRPAANEEPARRSEATAPDQRPDAIVDTAEEPGSESTIREHVLGANGDRRVTAFVSIMQGCEMYCTFCIVPYTRGGERSRPIAEIIDEVCRLVDQGVKEVTLLGQIVTSYGRKDIGKKNGQTAFVQLLEAVDDVEGLERIRFTSPHPKGFGDDLVQAYRDLPKLCEHAHLPIQSGSNRILKAMNRGYSREWFLRIVDKLRGAQPAIAISTDVIVGFPGETEEDFEQTSSLLREVEFDQAYIFKYSKRRDTPAADMPGQVSDEVKEQRNRTLLEILNERMLRKNRALVGQTVEVLVEGRSEKGGRRMMGRTRANRIVVFDGSERHKGALLPVRVERATTVALYGAPAIHGNGELELRSDGVLKQR
ncbi:MAG TPA: tRNA (N6-isopentenyl adenosine(37)-C2)-methylthiotransferase MiaB [Verrucomicrobiae bacterium]|nr:tRNA (N6-isopentenyl adenosine(37)-C2)-methylthiotransferase MiaB [Verrucomicrobiae bacterium]